MSSSTHTPGPWSLHPDAQCDAVAVDPADGSPPWVAGYLAIQGGGKVLGELKYHTTAAGYLHVDNSQEMRANARLVVAAPDLLASAKAFVGASGRGEFDDPFKMIPYVNAMIEAVAKAEAKS